VLRLQYINTNSGDRIPNMNSAIRGATKDELRIGRKGSFQWDAFVISMSSKRLKRCALKAVDRVDDVAIRVDHDDLAIRRKLEPGPVTACVLWQFERIERPFIEGSQIIKLNRLAVNSDGKNQALRIKICHRPAQQVH